MIQPTRNTVFRVTTATLPEHFIHPYLEYPKLSTTPSHPIPGKYNMKTIHISKGYMEIRNTEDTHKYAYHLSPFPAALQAV
jgi:hypothetical protein